MDETNNESLTTKCCICNKEIVFHFHVGKNVKDGQDLYRETESGSPGPFVGRIEDFKDYCVACITAGNGP
jgi:hypothetical protein